MADKIGLVAAMPLESRALLRLVKGVKHTHLEKLTFNSFSISDLTCVLVTSGMGVRRASQAAQSLLEIFSPHLLISFGIAGAVEEELNIGDVVLAEAFCQLEQISLGSVKKLAEWPGPAQEAVERILTDRGKRLYLGTTVTTTGSQVSGEQLSGITHPVLEMETAGIASVAAQGGIPFLSLRAISDGPRAPIPIDLSKVMDGDANLKVIGMLKAVIRNPLVIYQARRMLRNTTIAADQAALALYAALDHWSD